MELVSVVSPVKNSIDLLPQMIRSLDNQTYTNWEHIIIDGDSSDGSQQLLEKNQSSKRFYISDADQGIYDAINKGISRSKGRYICILNADDWYEADFLEKSIKAIGYSGADWVFGNNMFHYKNGTTQIIPGDPFYEIAAWSTFSRFHHTTVMVRRECFESIGLFPLKVQKSKLQSIQLNICSDYKWFLKLQNAGFRGYYVDSVMGHMRWGGISTTEIDRAHYEGKVIALSEFGNHKEIKRAWNLRRNRHRFKKIPAVIFTSTPRQLRLIARKLIGARLSSFVYENLKLQQR